MPTSYRLVLLMLLVTFSSYSAENFASNPFTSTYLEVRETKLDEIVRARWTELGLQPADLCSDAVFVRRAFLDVIGTLPSPYEARDFIVDRAADKRQRLIDKLLKRDEFAEYWANKWSDLLRVKAEFPINLWPNAAQAYHRWIRNAIRDNKPYDQFARELLTSSGSNFREGQVNFYRAIQNREPAGIAQAVALTFMGSRTEAWPKERLAGMAGFFSQVGFKATAEWKEEIVYWEPGSSNAQVSAVFPDGAVVRLTLDRDPRDQFADWLIDSKNPWFARAIVNRAWAWLMGRGIVHEPDDIRPDNPPSNPALLEQLEREFVASHYDLRQLYRTILNSKLYQLSSQPRSSDPRVDANFARYIPRRLDAEVLIDAINQITGTTENYSSPIPEPFTYIPEGARAVALEDGSITSPFLELFGRPPRDTGTEAERSNRPSAAQRLHLLNSTHIQRKLEDSTFVRNLTTKSDPRQTVVTLYLSILSRYPTEQESRALAAYSRTGVKGKDTVIDVAWALMNTAEFQFRH